MSSNSDTSYAVTVGKVKWFNNKAGYGFVTVCDDGAFKDNDIFVHYSAVKATYAQYKYLVQGEYVEFLLVKSDSGPHEYKATEVTGIRRGELMCETIHKARQQNATSRRTPGNETA